MDDQRKFSKQVLGRTVVSKSGKRFGDVKDLIYDAKTGELLHIILGNPTQYIEKLELEKGKNGELLVPYSAVVAVGDFVVISEEDIA